MYSAILRLAVVCVLGVAPLAGHSEGTDLFVLLKRVVNIGADVGDDVPVSSISRGLRRADPPGQKPRLPDNAALRASLNALDPATLHSLDNLSKENSTLLLRVFAGAKVLEKASPDRLMRARLLTEGGGDLILAAETHGDDVAYAAYRLLAAQDVGQLPVGSVQRFAEQTAKRGEGFLRVWKTWVEPNWKQLAGAGLITAFLADPDLFIDAAGNLTAYATDSFTRLGIRVATEVITAVPKTVIETVINQVSGPNGHWFLIGFAVIALPVLIWAVRKGALLLSAFARLFGWLGKFSRRPSSTLERSTNRISARRVARARSKDSK